jgi:signal transduction histidine kinase
VGAFRVQHARIVRREQEKAHRALEETYAKLDASHHELKETHQHLQTTQAQLIQSEKMASLGQLTAGIAHEIKNPLNFVNNFAQLSTELADEITEELDAHPDQTVAEVREYLDELLADLRLNTEKIEEHGRRANGIVHAMMQHASAGTGQRESTDINALVSEHIDLAYHGKRAQVPGFHATLERELDAEAGTVEVVPQEIGRVLLNLLGNAFDAVHEHALSVNGQYEPTVTVSTRQVDGQLEIRVCDNGPGIPSEIRNRIFEPFFTTKPTGSGTGLGLSLSYDIVTQGHGGRLTVESTEGEGATFVITLPMNSPNTG